MNRVCAVLLLIGFLSIPAPLYAQSISTDLSIDVIPTNPEPGQTVTLVAKSYSADLNQASLVWTYNNVVIARGTGKTTVGVVAPAGGATGIISVTATGSGFAGTSGSVVLRPASVDVLWEAADAYTPPFYKGKALLPVNGLIRFSAITSASAPKGVSYSWSRNGSALPSDSGYNKSSVVVKQSEFNTQEVAEVSVSGGVFSGNGTTHVSPLQNPSVITYQNKEGYIDYSTGYSAAIPFTQSGIVLHFEPYYFSVQRNILSELNFDLKIDGNDVTRTRPNEIGLSRPNSRGESIVDLSITPVAYSLQHVERKFTLSF